MGKYNAINIAKYIVKKCDDINKNITNLQMQKILFFIQKESIKKMGTGLFYNRMEAWKYGPVVPDVYYEYSGFGALPIEFYDFFEEVPNIEINDKALIDSVLNVKIDKLPWNLVDETHVKNGAWDYVTTNYGYNFPISESDIQNEIDKGL